MAARPAGGKEARRGPGARPATGARGAGKVDRALYPYRMRDLSARTGLPRQVLHFYIQQGLLPEGFRTGRNMAWYSEQHVERVQLIRRLQEERFLPLRAIRALLDNEAEHFTPRQRVLLSEVRQAVAGHALPEESRGEEVDADEVLARTGVPPEDLRALLRMKLISPREVGRGRLLLSSADADVVEAWGELRRIGFGGELGFRVEHLAMYEEAVRLLFQRELVLLASRFEHRSGQELAAMVERALPVVNGLLGRLHTTRVRRFLMPR